MKPIRGNNHFRNNNESKSFLQKLPYILTFVFAIVWILAVFKVFILEKRIQEPIVVISDSSGSVINSKSNTNLGNEIFRNNNNNNVKNVHKEMLDSSKSKILPTSEEWLSIRSNIEYKLRDNNPPNTIDNAHISSTNTINIPTKPNIPVEIKPKKINPTKIETSRNYDSKKLPHEFSWPPVTLNGSIHADEGFDIMPVIDLQVPRFWQPEQGVDMNKIGSKINDHETIFLMIASYRDFQCRETIASAFSKSDHPERLFVGAVDQIVPGDIGCLDVAIPCSEDPEQPLCKYRDQISVFVMDAEFATGPVTARHIGDRMYRGQYFVMQMDAHCLFVRHWDTYIIKQWESTGNEMAVLSSYLTDIQGSLDSNGDSTRHTRPIMCNSDFEGIHPARYLRHGSQPEDFAAIRDMPQLQPFWAAGFSFSRGHFKVRVPYDAYQPMVFQGEEIAIGIRGFTYGYDFYAPRDSVVFHEYAEKSSRRKKIHMFWENSATHKGEGQKSLRRSMAVIGMAPGMDPSTYDNSEIDKYGIGTVRDLSLFYKLFLIDPEARKATQLCPFVKSGIMHKNFQPFLRSDRLGIDYSAIAIQNFHTINYVNK